MELSREELLFSFLDESHTLTCQALSNLVSEAVRVNHPHDWKEKIGCCFKHGVRRHLKENLETSAVLTDVYVICKIIRYHINDIANFCGGLISSDARQKERLSLHVQGLAAARNWAFHDESVSAGEVRSSLALLLLILKTLRAKDAFVKRVGILLHFAEKIDVVSIFTPKDQDTYSISTTVCTRGMLYGCLLKFKEQFHDLLENVKTKGSMPSKCRHGSSYQQQGDFSTIVKRIKHEIYKSKKTSLLVSHERESRDKSHLFAGLENILTARNKLAHNEQFKISEIKNILEDLDMVLHAFGLASRNTASVIERLVLLQSVDNEDVVPVVLSQPSEKMGKQESGNNKQRQRILYPGSVHFVGRKEEIHQILTIMFRKDNPERNAVLIYGPSGIGKSYMAMHLVRTLRESYPRQLWFSCSSERELQQDTFINFQNVSSGSSNGPHQSGLGTTFDGVHACHKMNPHRSDGLVVLDDVCSTTLHSVTEMISKTVYCLILTTRNTAVKEYLEGEFPFLTTVELVPFTEAESWELIMQKIQNVKLDSCFCASAKEAVSSVLGNLPLCVSTYSSLLAFVWKGKSACKSWGVDSVSLLKKWREIEEQFGDHLHVRGLRGVVQCSEKYLEDHPLAVFLLAKLCYTDCESISWEVIKYKPQIGFLPGLQQMPNIFGAQQLCSSLLGVLDYLFCENGQDSLEFWRSNLEELGLIHWNTEVGIVHIHRLTLSLLQDLLEKRCYYLSSLVALAAGAPTETCSVKAACNTIFQWLRAVLLCQVIGKCADILCVEHSYHDNATEEKLCNVCSLTLSILGSSYCQRVLSKALTVQQVWQLHNRFAMGFLMSNELWGKWPSSPKHLFFGKVMLKLLKIFAHHQEVLGLFGVGGLLRTSQLFRKMAINLINTIGQNIVTTCLIHVFLASWLEEEEGTTVRKQYMLEASESCPMLNDEPKREELEGMLIYLKENRSYPDLQFIYEYTILYFRINQFRVRDIEKVARTQECSSLLHTIFEQVQIILLDKMEHLILLTGPGLEKSRLLQILSQLAEYTSLQGDFNILLSRPGLSLRALVKILNAVETHLSRIIGLLGKEERRYFLWSFLTNLVGNCCLAACFCGLFSMATNQSSSWQLAGYWSSVLSRLAQLLVPQWEKRKSLDQVNDHQVPEELIWSLSDIAGTEKLCIKLYAFAFKGLSLLYEEKSFQKALTGLLTVVTASVILRPQIDCTCGTWVVLELQRWLLKLISTLAAFLRIESSLEALQTLNALANNIIRPPFLKNTLRRAARVLIVQEKYSEPRNLYRHFEKARDAFEKGTFIIAHQASLKYWRELASAEGIHRVRTVGIDEHEVLVRIVITMLLQVADYLQHIYAMEKKYSVAEWFLRFRLHLAKNPCHWPFLSAVYGVEYVEFLKKEGRWPEAIEQCRLVERDLTGVFGEDYLTWIPNAPNVTLLRETLEKEVHTKN